MRNIFTIILLFPFLGGFSQESLIPAVQQDDGSAKPRLIVICDPNYSSCKALMEYVFTNDQQLVKYVNEQFSLELLDKSSEKSIQYQMKYRLRGEVAILLTESTGKLIRKIEGFKSGAELIELTGHRTKNSRTGYAVTPGFSNNYPFFYKNYFEKGNADGLDTMVVRSTLSANQDLTNEEAWNAYALFFPLMESLNERLLVNPDMLRNAIGWEEVDEVYSSFLFFVADSITNNNIDYLDQTIMPIMNRMNFESPTFVKNMVSAHFAVYRKQWAKAGEYMQEYMRDTARYAFKHDSVQAWCNYMYFHCEDKKALEVAEKTMRYLPFLLHRPDFTATLGLLQFKTNKWYEAESNLRKAMNYPLLLAGREVEINRVLGLIEAQKKKKKK